MIINRRHYSRREPSRDAKSVFIFCEGVKRESQYFRFFERLDSRIRIEIYPLNERDDHSPTGLFDIAKTALISSFENPRPKYDFLTGDEVWFIVDTDDWGPKLTELRDLIEEYDGWNVAQSNPCFEVWLYYHHRASQTKPDLDTYRTSKQWKRLVNTIFSGGFDSNSHPIFIGRAIEQAESNYEESEIEIELGSTQVFNLANVFYPFIQPKLDSLIHRFDLH